MVVEKVHTSTLVIRKLSYFKEFQKQNRFILAHLLKSKIDPFFEDALVFLQTRKHDL